MAGSKLLSAHCYIHRQILASKKMVPDLNEALSQSVKINNNIKISALNARLLNYCAMKWALIFKIFFSIRKFVGCPAVMFSRF